MTTIKISPSPRTISASWTASCSSEDLSEELSKEVAKSIQQEIDQVIMIQMLVIGGWYKIEIDHDKKLDDVIGWCHDQFDSNDWQHINQSFLFSKEQDASMFALRWK